MALFSVSENNLFGDILYDVVTSTNLRNVSVGSKTRAIAQALASKLGKAYKTFDANIALAFLDGAQGQYLDFMGEVLNTPRLGSSAASVGVGDQLVRFYVDTGTFGGINSGNAISLDAGTIISTATGGAGIQYRLTYPTILPSDQSQVYVSVTAVSPGGDSNIGTSQLQYCNFNNYSDSANSSLKVINDGNIQNGSNIELDTNYRYRISQAVISSETSNAIAVRLAALNVPGVADIVVVPYFRGIGTCDLLIKATVPTVSDSLAAAVNDAIANVQGCGNIIRARGPNEVGISLTGTLALKNVISNDNQTSLIQSVTSNVISYINNLDIGDTLVIEQLENQVLNTSSLIKRVGTTSKPFDYLYLYKWTRLQDNKIRSSLFDDYTANADDRVIVENQYAGDTPIQFFIS